MAEELSNALLLGVGVGSGFVGAVMCVVALVLAERMRPRAFTPVLGRAVLGSGGVALLGVGTILIGFALDPLVRGSLPHFGNLVFLGITWMGCSLGSRDLGLTAGLLAELHRKRDDLAALVVGLAVLGLAIGIRGLGAVVALLFVVTALA